MIHFDSNSQQYYPISRRRFLAAGALGTAGLAVAGSQLLPGAADDAPQQGGPARAIAALAGSQTRLVVTLGETGGTLIDALARQENFLIQGLYADAEQVQRARNRLLSAGHYGQATVAPWRNAARLPYADDLVNVMICEAEGGNDALLPEILRVLCPQGTVFVRTAERNGPAWRRWREALAAAGVEDVEAVSGGEGWFTFAKPRPRAMDEWTHNRYHGPDGNPVSQDRQAGPPAQLRWIADPSWQRVRGSPHASDRSPVFSGGRMFYVNVQATPATLGPTSLIARDAHNGLLLWTRPVSSLRNSLRGLIAQPYGVFATLNDREPYHLLNPATGETVRTYPELQGISDVVLYDGLLIAATGDGVKAVDARTGAVRWQHEERGSRLIAAGGRVFLRARRDLLCLDAATGVQRWRKNQVASADSSGIPTYGNGVLTWSTGRQLVGVSADNGRQLWTAETPFSYVLFLDGLFWATDGAHKRSRTTWLAVEPRTGNVAARIEPPRGYWTKGRCTLPIGLPGFVAGDSMEFIECSTGDHQGPRLARNACGIGFIPANGLIYTLPHGCQCYNTIRGTLGLAPAQRRPETPTADEARLERGPAFAAQRSAERPEAGAASWPTFRHDVYRSGTAGTELPARLNVLWETTVASADNPPADWLDNPLVSGRISAPVVAGGLAVVAVPDQHQVAALDATNGRERWRFTAGGRIDTPPTLFAGLCLFGCRDGWVYCLRSSDGALAWKFQAAPNDRQIMAHGQLESLWPVIGSVLAADNRVFAAAGRHSDAEGGIVLYALDPFNGRVIWSQTVHNLAQQVYPSRGRGIINDLLFSDGPTVRLNQIHFALRDGQPVDDLDSARRRRGLPPALGERRPLLFARGGGVLDRTWASRSGWHDGRGEGSSDPEDGQLLVTAETATYGVRVFPGRNGGFVGYGKELRHTPGRYELFARFYERENRGRERGWQQQVPVQVRALVLAGRHLFAAGEQDNVDPAQPKLLVLDAANGRTLADRPLSAPPVHDGFAAAEGRLYLSHQDGKLVCFGNG